MTALALLVPGLAIFHLPFDLWTFLQFHGSQRANSGQVQELCGNPKANEAEKGLGAWPPPLGRLVSSQTFGQRIPG
jgi:hypothetical protein